MKQDICIQTNIAFVFKASVLFLDGKFDNGKYHKWEYSCLLSEFLYTHGDCMRCAEKKNLITIPKKCKQRKQALCQHTVITKSQ